MALKPVSRNFYQVQFNGTFNLSHHVTLVSLTLYDTWRFRNQKSHTPMFPILVFYKQFLA
jgi:hypothetical protein